MDDRKNTIAGWVLFGCVVALGASIVSGEMFHHEGKGCADVKGGFCPAELSALSAGGGDDSPKDEKPFAFYMSAGDAAAGEKVFAKCTACHNADQGGANALGPNLYGVMGKPHAAHPGFAYSDALKGKPGNWDFDSMSEWLKSPRAYAPGTKMTFAGLSNPVDRANVIAFLNSKGSNLPLPAAPAEGAAPASADGDKAAAEAAGAGAEKAADTGAATANMTEAQAATGGPKNLNGDASPQGIKK